MQDLVNLAASMDTGWTLVGAALVFFMQAGFAMVETGFTRAKNAGNIIMKNLMDFSLGTPIFWLVGFGIMFGSMNGVFGGFDLLADGVVGEGYDWTTLIFQTVFCATAATIVSGSMAERTKFSAYCIYSMVISAVIYPISGHWIDVYKRQVLGCRPRRARFCQAFCRERFAFPWARAADRWRDW